MQLSSKARKVVATGLAISTVLWGSMAFVLPIASAAVHSEGCLVLSGGIVWMITNGTRRGYTSAEVFQSYGYNFSQVVTATAEDVALPVGPIMIYADGTLVKGPSDPLVYLVAGGQKRGFTTGSVFLGLGYQFANIQSAPSNTFADLPVGANMDSTTMAHPAGTQVITNGAVWMMDNNGRRGFTSVAHYQSYGYMLSHVVAANAADLALANIGDVPVRPACTGGDVVATGSINISLNGPASTTLINDESLATLANFVFSGTGTVTGVTLKRTGISADTTLSNVYLFDGTTRLTDAASVSSGSVINFTNSGGLFTVTGSRTVSVKADMAGSSGETVGVQLTAVTLSSGTAGGLPISGNNHSIATASLAGVNLASALTISDTDPGNDIVVFQGNAAITTRNVTLTRLALRQIGSIVNTDIKNFDFYVDGILVASQAALDANGYVTFTMSKSLTTGTRVLKVVADVIGGSGRTVQMSLRGAYDISTIDSQYNAAPLVTATGSFPFGDSTTFAINAGTATAPKSSDSPSSNVTVGASDVPLGRWTITAFGESMKVETLTVGVDVNGTDADNTLRNGRIMIGSSLSTLAQYGSTTDVAAVNSAATGQAYTVNYMVVPGTPAIVEFRADMYDNEGTDDIAALTTTSVQATLLTGVNNAIPQVSLGTYDLPGSDQDANALTISSGTISLAALASYPAQTTSVPQTGYKLASFTLTGNSTEAVNINTVAVGFAGADEWDPSSDLTNVYLKIGSSTTSTIKGTISDGSITDLANTWSQGFTVDKNGSTTIEVYADIASTAGDGTGDTMTTYMRVTGITAQSGTTVYADVDSDTVSTDNGATGQVITVGTGTITISQDASAPTAKIIDDSGVVVVQAYKFQTATDSFTITDLALTMGSATAVAGVVLKDGSTVVGASKTGTSITWSGMEVPVQANQSKVLTVEVTLSTIGYQAGTSDSSLIATLGSFTARNSSGTSDESDADAGPAIESTSNFAGPSIYAYKAIPTITTVALPNSNLAGGTGVVIAKFTVSSGGTGTIAWKQAMFEVSKSAADILASPALYNADTGEAVSSTAVFQNSSEGSDTDCDASDTTCEILVTVDLDATGSPADDNTVESISGAKTYELRADISGTIAATDSVSVKLDRNTTTHAAKGAYTAKDNTGTGGVSFVWTDGSDSLGITDTGASQWLSDYLVKNLPISWNMN